MARVPAPAHTHLPARAALVWAALGVVYVVWGSTYLAIRIALDTLPPFLMAMEMVAGGALLLLLGLGTGELTSLRPSSVSSACLLALASLIVFGSLLAFSAYVWLLRAAPVTLVATYAYVNPVVAVLLGWAVLGEPLTPRAPIA